MIKSQSTVRMDQPEQRWITLSDYPMWGQSMSLWREQKSIKSNTSKAQTFRQTYFASFYMALLKEKKDFVFFCLICISTYHFRHVPPLTG